MKQLTFNWYDDLEDENTSWVKSRSEMLMEKSNITFDMVEYERPNSWGVSDSCYSKHDLSGVNYLPQNWSDEDVEDYLINTRAETTNHYAHNDAPERLEKHQDEYTLSEENIEEYSSYAQKAKEQMERPSDKKKLKKALTEILDVSTKAMDQLPAFQTKSTYAGHLRMNTNLSILKKFIDKL